MDHVPDNYDLFEMHDAQLERNLKGLPECAKCGEPITSERAYEVDGWYCESCFEEYVKDISAWTEDLIEEEGW